MNKGASADVLLSLQGKSQSSLPLFSVHPFQLFHMYLCLTLFLMVTLGAFCYGMLRIFQLLQEMGQIRTVSWVFLCLRKMTLLSLSLHTQPTTFYNSYHYTGNTDCRQLKPTSPLSQTKDYIGQVSLYVCLNRCCFLLNGLKTEELLYWIRDYLD